MIRPHRNHPLWLAFILHRISGLALALFLPLHFMLLGLALDGETSLENGLRWTDSLFFKVAEFGLVFLLAIHMFGGLRLIAFEFLLLSRLSNNQKSWAAAAVAGAFAIATGFFLSAVST